MENIKEETLDRMDNAELKQTVMELQEELDINQIKVLLDKAQSGGDRITLLNNKDEVIAHHPIHQFSKHDGHLIWKWKEIYS